MRRYVLVIFEEALQWRQRDQEIINEDARQGRAAVESEAADPKVSQKQLMSRDQAEASAAGRSAGARCSYSSIPEEKINGQTAVHNRDAESEAQRSNRAASACSSSSIGEETAGNGSRTVESMLLKCMCSSVLLLCSITALLLLLPLVLPAPLPPPPFELLLLPLLILLVLMCLAVSPPSNLS